MTFSGYYGHVKQQQQLRTHIAIVFAIQQIHLVRRRYFDNCGRVA